MDSPSAENDVREMAEAVVYDTLMDDRGEAEDADSFDLARRIVADLIESGYRVIPPLRDAPMTEQTPQATGLQVTGGPGGGGQVTNPAPSSDYDAGFRACQQAVYDYCEISATWAEENPDPHAVGLAKAYRDIQGKVDPGGHR